MKRMIIVIILLLYITTPITSFGQADICNRNIAAAKHNTKCYKRMFKEKKPAFWSKIKLPTISKKDRPEIQKQAEEKKEPIVHATPKLQLPKVKMPRLKKASALDCPH